MTLRTPPVKESLLAIRERLDALGLYNGLPIGDAIDDLYDRVGVIIEPPPPPPPDPETELLTEGFDAGLDGEDIDVNETAFDSRTGAGTLTYSSTHSDGSGLSLHVNGSAADVLRKDVPTHTTQKGKWYYWHGATPTATAWFLYVYAANGTTVAYRVGVTATGAFIIQDGAAGTTDTSSFTAVVGKCYRFDDIVTAGTSASIALYSEPAGTINATSGPTDTISVALGASDLSAFEVGLVNALTGGGTTIPANLTDEGFNGTNGVQITDLNTTADTHSGTGTLTFNTGYAKEGTSSMRVNGTGYDILVFNNTSMSRFRASCYLKFTNAPGTNRSIFLELKNGANSAPAFQIGIDTAGKLFCRDANSGSGNKLATAATAFASGSEYRLEIDGTASGTLVMYLYRAATGAGVDSTDIWQTITMVDPITATNLGNEWLGQIAAVTTAADYSIDRWKSSNSGMPSAVGAGTGAAVEYWLENIRFDTTTMPANVTIDVGADGGGGGGGTVNAKLEPPNGTCWWGCTAGPTGTSQGSTTTSGLAAWIGFAGRRPDIIHVYKTEAWNGELTTEERSWAEPSGQARAILFYTWKINRSLTMADLAAGGADARLQAFCTGIKKYPHTVFLSLYHEFDNDLGGAGSGNTAANYAAMWQHCVTYIRNQGVTNVVFVINYVGYSGLAGSGGSTFEAMYPGDTYIDWVAFDPYFETGSSRDDLADLMNEAVGNPGGGYTGFYNWATGAHPTKPIMVAEWSPNFLGSGMSDSVAAAKITSIGQQLASFPKLKALVQWNSYKNTTFDARIQGHPSSVAAFASVGARSAFNVGTSNAA